MASTSYKSTREVYDSYFAPTYNPYPIVPVRGIGSFLHDMDGKEYIDFGGGIAVNAMGHCHPEVVEVLKEQSKKLWHLSNNFINLPAIELSQKLVSETFADNVFFNNSGTEANETALKLARKRASLKNPDKSEIIAFDGGFHGRSLFTVAVGGKEQYREGFGPLPPNIRHLPFNDIDELGAISDSTCAVIVEPVQGENGIVPANKKFLEAIRKACDKHDVLLIFDEIQIGMGRSGSLFSYQHYNVTPDILTTAKALGGGIPISAMITTKEIASAFQPGLHGSTFGGNPLACSVAAKVFDLINNDTIRTNVFEQSTLLHKEINTMLEEFPVADSPRGVGLLIGIPLKDQYKDKLLDFCMIALSHGLIVLQSGNGVIRIAPALNIPADVATNGIAVLRKTFETFSLKYS